MIVVDEELADIDASKPVTIDGLQYLAQRASYRLSVDALNRLAVILLGSRAAKDWTFEDLYSAAREAKIAEAAFS